MNKVKELASTLKADSLQYSPTNLTNILSIFTQVASPLANLDFGLADNLANNHLKAALASHSSSDVFKSKTELALLSSKYEEAQQSLGNVKLTTINDKLLAFNVDIFTSNNFAKQKSIGLKLMAEAKLTGSSYLYSKSCFLLALLCSNYSLDREVHGFIKEAYANYLPEPSDLLYSINFPFLYAQYNDLSFDKPVLQEVEPLLPICRVPKGLFDHQNTIKHRRLDVLENKASYMIEKKQISKFSAALYLACYEHNMYLMRDLTANYYMDLVLEVRDKTESRIEKMIINIAILTKLVSFDCFSEMENMVKNNEKLIKLTFGDSDNQYQLWTQFFQIYVNSMKGSVSNEVKDFQGLSNRLLGNENEIFKDLKSLISI